MSLSGINRSIALARGGHASTISKSRFSVPHCGQHQSSGTSAHRVPGAIPSSGKPSASLYMKPQALHCQVLKSPLIARLS
jgi:hypothetical protein